MHAGGIVVAEDRAGELQVEACPVRVPSHSTCTSSPMVRSSSPIHAADGGRRDRVRRLPSRRAVLERHRQEERADPHARRKPGVQAIFEEGFGRDRSGFLSSSPQLVASRCATNTSPIGWVDGGAKAAELQTAVVFIETELAQTAVEVVVAAIRVESAQIEWRDPTRSHGPLALNAASTQRTTHAARIEALDAADQ